MDIKPRFRKYQVYLCSPCFKAFNFQTMGLFFQASYGQQSHTRETLDEFYCILVLYPIVASVQYELFHQKYWSSLTPIQGAQCRCRSLLITSVHTYFSLLRLCAPGPPPAPLTPGLGDLPPASCLLRGRQKKMKVEYLFFLPRMWSVLFMLLILQKV